MVSSHGNIHFKKDFGPISVVEPYYVGQHAYVSLYDNKMEKQEYMLAELLLLIFRSDSYHIGARIIFTDGNCKNIHIDNLRFRIKTIPIVEDSELTTKWKCTTKALSSNERYKDRTREKLTGDEVAFQLKSQNFYCYYCGDQLKQDDWQLDHKTPVSKNGNNSLSNIVCACKGCNTIKGTLDEAQFYSIVEKLAIGMGIIESHVNNTR